MALHRFLAERAGAKGTREVAGASHALTVSAPDVVTASILDAITLRYAGTSPPQDSKYARSECRSQ
jgi:hypothetical protein